CRFDPAFDPATARQPVNRWMIGRIVALVHGIDNSLAAYRFDEAANALYHGIWGEFCDWYVEFAKPVLAGSGAGARDETRAAVAWSLGQLLHLLHPFMPFLTEELWQHVRGPDAPLLITAPWPKLADGLVDAAAAADTEWAIRLIEQVRALRSEMNV